MRFDFAKLSRRRLLMAGTAISSTIFGSRLAPAPALAATPAAAKPSRTLPQRGEFVVRGAYVLTMDPALGDLPNGDIHVKGRRDRRGRPRALSRPMRRSSTARP